MSSDKPSTPSIKLVEKPLTNQLGSLILLKLCIELCLGLIRNFAFVDWARTEFSRILTISQNLTYQFKNNSWITNI